VGSDCNIFGNFPFLPPYLGLPFPLNQSLL